MKLIHFYKIKFKNFIDLNIKQTFIGTIISKNNFVMKFIYFTVILMFKQIKMYYFKIYKG